jgi:hypothetical protein
MDSNKLENLEKRIKRLEKLIANPPKFQKGDDVINKSPCGRLKRGFISSWFFTTDEWLYVAVDETGEATDTWREDNLVLASEVIKFLKHKGED